MSKKDFCKVMLAGSLSFGLTSFFVTFPVSANNPVDIEIVEVVDDGDGNLKPWQDITSAMPGETYSAIPRLVNNGEVPVEVRMCIFESATNGVGETISMRSDTFGISINENWTLDNDTVADTLNPASGNCYKYNNMLNSGELTEPLFTEVSLNPELENEYQGVTFNLHLDATAIGDEIAKGSGSINNPDTGTPTASESLSSGWLIFFSAGIVGLAVMVVFMLRKRLKK